MPDIIPLIPTIVELVNSNDHEIGDETEARNIVAYEEDGWSIDIVYDVTGHWYVSEGDYWTPPVVKLLKAYGQVRSITASHEDDYGHETVFTPAQLQPLREAIDINLSRIYP